MSVVDVPARISAHCTGLYRSTTKTSLAAFSVMFLTACLLMATLMAPLARPATAPVGQGFSVTPSDLAYILKQIKISEAHVANTTAATGPCGALLGNGPNQIPNPLLSFGLRTVDGSCNNLQPGRDKFGGSDQKFPRYASPVFKSAGDAGQFAAPGTGQTSYAQKSGSVVDPQPRIASNLIVDQTSTNPAAVAAAGFPVRSQGNPGVVPCDTDPDPLANPPVAADPVDCTPSHQTLFIPNVTTDVGLSPPYNSLFTLFGQFFDHGLDFVSKGGSGTVFVPLQDDDPLVAGDDHIFGNADDLPAAQRFMVLSRATNGPGPDGQLGTADDDQNGTNRDSPFVDQSQTYTSHASHQVFVREYVDNTAGRPVATGKLLGSADGGMATWAQTKAQARTLLGLQLTDKDALNIPMIAADPYGKFIPGPARGLPQYVTPSGLVEGDRTANGGLGVLAPANVNRISTAFLDDIAHNAVPAAGLTPDPDSTITPAESAQPTGTYDNEMLDAHFIAGDGRVNENIGLTAIHQIFHSEHDRLVADIKNTLTNDTSAQGVAALSEWKLAQGAAGWNGERLFQAARFVNEMEYQHLVFEEFARKIQPLIEPFTVYHDNVNPAIHAEYAHAVYRFGHSMLTETISRTNADGSSNDIPLLEGFLNPPAYTQSTPGGPSGALSSEQAAGSIIMGMSDQTGNELDEFVADTLRNNLLGLPLDLPTLNMARARDTGTPPLNVFRRDVYAQTNDAAMKPYSDWIDFGLALKHPESLVNFVAAYGRHPSILAESTLAGKRTAAQLLVAPPAGADPASVPADAFEFMNSTGASWANNGVNSRTGLDDIDLWVGGLAERTNLFGGLLGSTFNYVFESQLTDLQNGDRFYYLARTPGMNLRAQLEGNSFAEMMMRNTDAHSLKADAFGTADCKFELSELSAVNGNSIVDDPSSECDESALLIRMADGTIRYRTTNSVDPAGINGQAVYNGTDGVDRVNGGVDNDTFLGNEANDIIEGNDGADVALGGTGNDVITDLAGDDVPKGGPGNDAIDAGPGLDIVMGGAGKDFTNGGLNANETFGAEGDDFVIAGAGTDTVFGDSGSDWEEGGDGQDLLCGDSCAPFFDDPNEAGHDILIGQDGEEDYDAEGGDDILIADAGIERNAGAGGFDWSTYERDTLPANADLALRLIGVPLPVGVFRDRHQEVEALSGGPLSDTLRGDDLVPTGVGGTGFTGCDVLDQAGLDRIAGLDPLVPALNTPLAAVVANAGAGSCPLSGPVWGDGNIIIGGPGSDLIEGRGADDIIDGDKYLGVRLSVRTNPANPATQIGTTDLMEHPYLPNDPTTLEDAVFAGAVDPANIVAVREILSGPTPATNEVDTALFSGPRADYDIETVAGTTKVVHARGTGLDGTDTLTRVERLRFSDQTVNLTATSNRAPTGSVEVSDTTPTEDQLLSAVRGFQDPDGINESTISYRWEIENNPNNWRLITTGPNFTPNDVQVGSALRVQVTFMDNAGVFESLTSAPTAPVANVNDAPVGRPTLSNTTPRVGDQITASTASISDADGLLGVTFSYRWQQSIGNVFVPIIGATDQSFTARAAQRNRTLRVVVSYTDAQGTAEQVTSAATAPVAAAAPAAVSGLVVPASVGADRASPIRLAAEVPEGASMIEIRVTRLAQAKAKAKLIAVLTRETPQAGHYEFRLNDNKQLRHPKPGRYRIEVRAGAGIDELGAAEVETIKVKKAKH